jgi:hypothetical protein
MKFSTYTKNPNHQEVGGSMFMVYFFAIAPITARLMPKGFGIKPFIKHELSDRLLRNKTVLRFSLPNFI